MGTHIEYIIGIVCLVIVMPFALMLLNVSGYQDLKTDTYLKVSSEDFNLLTFQGIGIAINFFIELASFTVVNVGLFWVIIFSVISLISIGVLFLYLRGTN